MSLRPNPTLTLLTLLLTAALVAAAVPTTAQADLVGTHLDVETTPPVSEGDTWDGSSASGMVNVALCSDEEGGFNPAGGEIEVEIAVSGPGWVEIEASPESITLAPAMGPEAEAPGCMDSGSFSITVQADDVQHDSTVELSIALSVSEAGGDEDVPLPIGTGTYAAPSDESTTMSFNTVPAPSDSDTDDNGDDTTDPSPGDTNDSPAPAVTVVVLVALALRGLRRRA